MEEVWRDRLRATCETVEVESASRAFLLRLRHQWGQSGVCVFWCRSRRTGSCRHSSLTLHTARRRSRTCSARGKYHRHSLDKTHHQSTVTCHLDEETDRRPPSRAPDYPVYSSLPACDEQTRPERDLQHHLGGISSKDGRIPQSYISRSASLFRTAECANSRRCSRRLAMLLLDRHSRALRPLSEASAHVHAPRTSPGRYGLGR